MSEVFSKVKEIICDQLGVEESQVVEDARFVEDLNADSLDTVDLIMALEEEYEIEIPDEEAQKIKTVGDAVNYITKNTN